MTFSVELKNMNRKHFRIVIKIFLLFEFYKFWNLNFENFRISIENVIEFVSFSLEIEIFYRILRLIEIIEFLHFCLLIFSFKSSDKMETRHITIEFLTVTVCFV